MDKEHIRHLWKQEPITKITGEDMQLSFFAQKHGGIKTYVPPHPPSQGELWGSNPETGHKFGTDEHAMSGGQMQALSPVDYNNERNRCVTEMIKQGWKLSGKESPHWKG